MDLSRVVAVANGKGGVGKTSLVANLAGEFARAGSKVLAVDLDVSGNLKLDLGTVGHDKDDAGRGIFEAITDDEPLNVVADVRPGVDWIPGGRRLNWLIPVAAANDSTLIPRGSVEEAWRKTLAELIEAGGYDMVLLDCPPGNQELQMMALAAAKWVVVPMKSDAASLEGLQMLAPLVKKARQTNEALEWLGIVLFGHGTSATRVRQTVNEYLEGMPLELFDTAIRSSESTAQACRMRGLLVHELAERGSNDSTAVLQALRARKKDPSVEIPKTVSKTSTSLAGDYAALANEVATRILAREGEQ